MNFEKKLRIQILISVIFGVAGIAALIIGMYLSITQKEGFAQGFLIGTGGGLIAAGIFMTIQKIRILNNSERLRKFKIENSDERNLYLSYKSSNYALIATALLMYVSSFYFVFVNKAVFYVLILLILLILLMRVFIYLILKKIA